MREAEAISAREEYREIVRELDELGDPLFRSLISGEQYFQLYSLVEEWIEPASRILDWGCGSGHISYFLLRRGFVTEAFSIQPADFVELLTSRYPDTFNFTLDPEAKKTLPYGDGQFDGVLSVGVLEHVRETGGEELASLKEINRVLKEGGVFICYHLPNRYSWIDFSVRMLSNRLHRHDYRYTRKEIAQMLAPAELELQQCQRYGFLPRLPFRSLPRWIAMSKSLAASYNALDWVLSRALSWFDQNYYFVAVKV